MRRYYIAMILLAVISAASVAANQMARAGGLADKKIEQDIRTIQEAIQSYADEKDMLPARLEDLSPDNLNQPLSAYQYQKLEAKRESHRYELCATFRTDTLRDRTSGSEDFLYIEASQHNKGRHCFKGAEYIYPGGNSDYYYDYPDEGPRSPEPTPDV